MKAWNTSSFKSTMNSYKAEVNLLKIMLYELQVKQTVG